MTHKFLRLATIVSSESNWKGPTNLRPVPLRLAVLTESISHFEVPLFRLSTAVEGMLLKVFYIQEAASVRYDSVYGQEIKWGNDLLAGYDSERVADAAALEIEARKWAADVILLYGYAWHGAPKIIVRNWWSGKAQVHRGTLSHYTDPRRPIKSRLLKPIGQLLLRLFHAHHYGGDYSQKALLSAGVDEAAQFFVPYSVDSTYFIAESQCAHQLEAALNIRQSNNWAPVDHVILFIAQHSWFKGPDIAMDVFRQTASKDPKARFLVVGSGQMTKTVKAYAGQHIDPKSIHFAGFVPSAETVPYYLASDLVICTSRYETWARMVNEAMLCCRPCLVSKVVAAAGGLVAHGENGYVVEKPKVSLFARAIQEYFSLSRHERWKMGEAARERAQEFAYEPHIDNVLAAARYALAKTNPGKTKTDMD